MLNFLKNILNARSHYPMTQHYDGSKFKNNPPTPPKKFFEVMRMLFSSGNVRWPKSVPIKNQTPPAQPDAGRIIFTYINHSTFLIQTNMRNILTDPIFSSCAGPQGILGPKRVRQPGINFDDLPKIDIVLISHNHYDHMDIPSLIKLAEKSQPLFIVPLGNKNYLTTNNIANVIEHDWWDEISLTGEVSITIVPAKHWSRRSLTDTNAALWCGFYLEIDNHKIYFAGDTGYSELFKMIKQKLGAPDISMLPIGAYMPQWFMQSSHIDPKEAVQVHKDLESKLSVAMHHRTFKLSHEGIDDPANTLARELIAQGIEPGVFKILENGESFLL